MKKYQEPNYNIDGVDLNIYTVKRDDDIEYYADKLDYLKAYHKDKYNMITMIIEMTSIIQHNVNAYNDENIFNKDIFDKNFVIREISRAKSARDVRIIKNIIKSFDR